MIRTLRTMAGRTWVARPYRSTRVTLGRVRRRIDILVSSALQRPALERFRNIHLGERCFLIGNGPSLRGVDLGVLAHERTFVTNHFDLHPQLATLQPTYYCVSDLWFFNADANSGWQGGLSRFPLGTTFFLPIEMRRVVKASSVGERPRVYYLRCNRTREIWKAGAVDVDVTRVLYTGDTVVLDFCLPLAHFMGFSEVFLLGCDTDYGTGAGSGHFYEERTPTRSPQYHRDVWYGNVTQSYEIVRRVFEASGRRIYNATDGGRLDVFPRISLEAVLARPHPIATPSD